MLETKIDPRYVERDPNHTDHLAQPLCDNYVTKLEVRGEALMLNVCTILQLYQFHIYD